MDANALLFFLPSNSLHYASIRTRTHKHTSTHTHTHSHARACPEGRVKSQAAAAVLMTCQI